MRDFRPVLLPDSTSDSGAAPVAPPPNMFDTCQVVHFACLPSHVSDWSHALKHTPTIDPHSSHHRKHALDWNSGALTGRSPPITGWEFVSVWLQGIDEWLSTSLLNITACKDATVRLVTRRTSSSFPPSFQKQKTYVKGIAIEHLTLFLDNTFHHVVHFCLLKC